MKVTLAALLFAMPSLAQVTNRGDIAPVATVYSGSNLIIIGNRADVEPDSASCSVALGDGVIVHGSHRIATAEGERSLYWIGPALHERINAEMRRVMVTVEAAPYQKPFLTNAYVAHWNGVCGTWRIGR